MTFRPPAAEVPPFRLSGTVYCAMLNDASQLAALGAAVDAAPYKGAPIAPVLSIKPRNTFAGDGDDIAVPADVPSLEIGATLGIVIGRTACRLARGDALAHVSGYTIVNDVSVPLASHYRPAVRFRARDGFCPMGPRVVAASEVADPDALRVQVFVDGVCVGESHTGSRIRDVAQLLSDVTEFMTLHPGDVLTLGTLGAAVRAGAGQSVAIAIEGLGRLTNHLVAPAP